MNITLVTHDGFVKQMAIPDDQANYGRSVRTAVQADNRRPWLNNFATDAYTAESVTYHIREFVREGNTTVFKERP